MLNIYYVIVYTVCIISVENFQTTVLFLLICNLNMQIKKNNVKSDLISILKVKILIKPVFLMTTDKNLTILIDVLIYHNNPNELNLRAF